MNHLVTINVSLYQDGPQRTLVLPATAASAPPGPSVLVCDTPMPPGADQTVLDVSLTGLLDGSGALDELSGGDPIRYRYLVAEVLRTVTEGALAARGLRTDETVDWHALARELG